MQHVNLLTVFLTGILAGGLSCMAVQGGLLAATIAQREQKRLERALINNGYAIAILSFLLAKLFSYTLLGALLGFVGSFFALSLRIEILLQVIVAIFMIGTVLNILNVHPIFRYFVIQPPRFLTRIIWKRSKSKELFAPVVLGAFTIFIPCGTTQAMMALAIGTGSPTAGAAILFAFVLGTSPIFFLLSYFAAKLGTFFEKSFLKVAALVILFLALFTLNNSIALTGSQFTVENIVKGVWCSVSFCDDQFALAEPANQETITISDNGYSPNMFAVKAGSSVRVHLVNHSGGGCTQAFTIPSLGIVKVVPLGSSNTLTFKAPLKKGDISFMCGMGMYRGTIQVI